MKTFLQEVAEDIIKDHPRLSDVIVVLPNRRAALYLRKYLAQLISKPTFAPSLVTIEDFISSFSDLKCGEKLELIHTLYQTYQKTLYRGAEDKEQESFDQFFFWGDMLLRDFDEIDRYLINADHLFKDLSNQKELDSAFDYLTEEQQKFLKNFWNTFQDFESPNKNRFLKLWQKLPEVYSSFRNQLLAKGQAYEGMLHRLVAESISTASITASKAEKTIKFVGFNALTPAEEKIIALCVESADAKMYWDIDQYYFNNKNQEAGKFFRAYDNHAVFKKTFPAQAPANFSENHLSKRSTVKLFGAAQPVAQAKLMSEVLHQQIDNFKAEETLIVLPDEKLLMPVLYGIADTVEDLNVTMGFPLNYTPMFNLIEILADLQISRKGDHFNHRETLALLGHPYVVAADAVAVHNKRKEILKHNWVHIPKGFLATEVPLHRIIFQEFEKSAGNTAAQFISYIKEIIYEVGRLKGISDFDKEYALHFIKICNKIETVFYEEEVSKTDAGDPKKIWKGTKQSLKAFVRLLRQLVRSEKIPFSGEPLKGLQVMGVLETRNIDFKNVFVLSLNEGAFPAASNKSSYIPFNIRKAYNLPTQDHQDSIYAYLFYRLLQRAENVYLFYNSETDVLGQGEMSRYLQQLIYESGISIEKKILDNPIQPLGISAIAVDKSNRVMDDLFKLNEGNVYFQGISPSALNTYLECRLKFYFRHVAKIREADEVEEELDARVLGNFLHDVMEKFYKRMNEKKGSKAVELKDYNDHTAVIEELIDKVFIKAYRLDPEKKVEYEGQRLVVKEIVKRFADRIIEMDKAYTPFNIELLEQSGITYTIKLPNAPYKAVLGGKIDRVDKKDEVLRIIDYKTGKDKLDFDTIESLFSREDTRNKAAFQTLLYALLYKRTFGSNGKSNGERIVPGLINRLNLFDEEFTFGLKSNKEYVTDVEPLLPEFEARLTDLFIELFNPDVPFDQTSELENCKICPYSKLCYR
jgi:hypothetical protein